MTSTAQMYGYVRASSLGPDGLLDLQTSGGTTTAGPAAHPRFFSGFLAEAEPAAAALLGVANVAQARYWRPSLAALRDPVVTCNGDRLRFESFSGCCGVYARLDVLDSGLDGLALDRGTTNVDVNDELRVALARVRGGDPLKLEVGPEGLEATTFDDAELIGALLAFDARVEPDRLAAQSRLPAARVRAALTQLGTAGRVGYDHADAAFFHRELPYDAERAARQNPRLRAARDLLDANAVAWDGAIATVTVADHVQRVREAADGELSCTCQWYATYQGGRGPCKHILAADAYRRGERGSLDSAETAGADEEKVGTL